MGSLGTGEILVIVLVVLIVFGPKRLPEITRKAGEWMAKIREMTRSVTNTLDAEYGDITAPIKDLKGDYDATMSDMKGVASSVTDMSIDLSEAGRPAAGDREQTPDDADLPDDPEPPTLDEEAP
ncbi:MAG: twin-arginine translocase TatA/TatE family subunit [Actinomycetota bacterium]|nr:twin-arginine translocase TatA/TatE family subunit [Actinomycetota bacterium]